jgi:acyl dehydratase
MSNHTPTSPQEPLFLDDMYVGQRYKTSAHRMTEDDIVAFARQFDPQPFHLDQRAAKETFFGQLVASGWHTAAITMRLLVESGLPIAGGMIGAAVDITWPKPTRPGDVLHVESEIIEIKELRSRPDRGMATFRHETRNQNGEIVQIQVARMLVPRRV